MSNPFYWREGQWVDIESYYCYNFDGEWYLEVYYGNKIAVYTKDGTSLRSIQSLSKYFYDPENPTEEELVMLGMEFGVTDELFDLYDNVLGRNL